MRFASALRGLVALAFVFAVGCGTQPQVAEPSRAQGPVQKQTSDQDQDRASTPAPKPAVVMAETLAVLLPEPVMAGKNPVTPFDIGPGSGSGAGGAMTCTAACRRIISHCLIEVMEAIVAKGKISRQRIDKMRRSGMLKKLKKSNLKNCSKICAKPKSRNYARLQVMKLCAAKRTCTAVGTCAAKHIAKDIK